MVGNEEKCSLQPDGRYEHWKCFFFFFNGTPSELKLQYNDLLNLQSVNQSDMQRFSNKLFKDNRSGSDPSCMLFL